MTASHDKLLTMADAAKTLGLSKTALGKLARNGLIHEVREGRLCRYYRSEILHIRKLRDRHVSSKDICDDLLILKFTMRRVKELLYHVSSRLEIGEKYDEPRDGILNIWYESAVATKYAAEIDIRESSLSQWYSIFQRLHEIDFHRLKHIRGDPAPFAPFFAVADRLIVATGRDEGALTCSRKPLVGWSNIFKSARRMLRERAILFTAEEPADLTPVVRVDGILDPSMRVDFYRELLDIDASPLKDGLISGPGGADDNPKQEGRKTMDLLNLMSQTKAAGLLQTNKAAVGKYAAAGLLTTYRKHGRKMYPAAEVQKLAELRDRGVKPRRIGEDLLALELELTKLRRYLENICAHLGVSDKFVTYTDDELRAWYDKARKYAEAPGHDSQKFPFDEWIVALANINEAELLRLEKLTEDKAPFLPFVRLCEKVIELAAPRREKHVRGPRIYLDWIYLFAMARDRMREKAMIFLSARKSDLSPARLFDLAMSGRISLLNVDSLGRKMEVETARRTARPIKLKPQTSQKKSGDDGLDWLRKGSWGNGTDKS